MIYKGLIYSMVVLLFFTGCKKEDNNSSLGPKNLKEYLVKKCAYVHEINGFYVVASDETPKESNGSSSKEIWTEAIKLFSNYLDQDEDGVIDSDKNELADGLSKNMIFCVGSEKFVNALSESSFTGDVENTIGFMTDKWPYDKSYTGKGWTLDQLSSSTWRPEPFNAIWEETYHTVTEALSRIDDSFKFTEGKLLRVTMDADIADGTYKTEVQNKEENGNYDKVTAVNEYIHQIWAISNCGQESKLNSHQTKALKFMKEKGVDLRVNPKYAHQLGNTVKPVK
ncbi:hypothetical protein K4L44_13900 [Halosquirtibacter laminarini]|uniref:Uncharacterized protein n=1 Tax=Halosquirtibacter laminarini TaxID=3374600 RepID=A0AC61NNX5_9BACT|nr:hypothetical protein K4L44_13900 [Prolixibacteraceae bacterium]